jgi:hypothetical protein
MARLAAMIGEDNLVKAMEANRDVPRDDVDEAGLEQCGCPGCLEELEARQAGKGQTKH